MLRPANHQIFGQPAAARFFFEEEGAGGGGVAVASPETSGGGEALADFSATDPDTTKAPSPMERVEGEKLPDFSALGKKPALVEPEGGKAPAKEGKPAGEAPGSGARPPEKTPEGKKPAEKPPEGKKAAAPAKPAEKPAAAKPAEPKAVEKGAKAEAAPKILSDAEIDAMQPKPGVPTSVIKDFGAMRSVVKEHAAIARTALAERETLAKELETLKASSGKLPDEIDKELNGLRQFHMLFNAQNDPQFQREFDGKIQAAEENVFSLLAKHGLDQKVIDQIKNVAGKNAGDIEKWPHWSALLKRFTNPLDQQTVINALQGRRDAITAKHGKLDQLIKDRSGYMKTMADSDAAEKKKWSDELGKEAMRIGTDFEPAIEKDIPDGASEEVKKAIELHNAGVKTVAESFKQNVLAAYNRDPKATAKLAFDGVRADHLQSRVKEMEATIESKETRIAELEAQIAKIKHSGRMGHESAPTGETGSSKTTVEEGKVGGDGATALRNFFDKR